MSGRRRAIGVVVALCVAAIAGAVQAEERQYEMTTYQLALLHIGAERAPIGEREIQRLQEGRLAWLAGLYEAGKLIIEGPIDGGAGLRGIVVLDAGSVEEAAKLLDGDPWIAAGRVRPEIHPWWAAKGILQRPTQLDRTRRCWLGLLERPPEAPDYPEEKLKEIQAGHMQNIQRMADSGDLVIAGPMGDDGVLRGIFVFRTEDSSRVVEMFRQDPAHAAGRLMMRLFPWHVPAESFP